MNVISAALDEIAARAKDASREVVDMLHLQLKALDGGAKAAISLGTLGDTDLVETGEARRRALDALDATLSAIMRHQLALIGRVPEDRPSRATLVPMSAPALLLAAISHASDQIDHVIRNEGEGFELFRDGVREARVDAHSIRVEKDELVIGEAGRWKLCDIQATSDEDGFAFVLDDGTHIEILRMA